MEAALPKISVVTPSLNQGVFLESAIDSVLGQGYPDLEYLVVDGGSSDDSVEVIERHSERLTYWVSEPDEGMYDAINKGFALATGDILGWLNSDDMYLPWTFSVVAELFDRFPEIEWLTSSFPMHWDAEGRAVRCWRQNGYSKERFLRGENLPNQGWHAQGWIPQECTFWRRSLWERAGGRLDASLRLAGDFELWSRFFSDAPLFAVDTPLGGFRYHGRQMSSDRLSEYVAEARSILDRAGFRPPSRARSHVRRLRQVLPDKLAKRVDPSRGPRCVHQGPGGGWTIVT